MKPAPWWRSRAAKRVWLLMAVWAVVCGAALVGQLAPSYVLVAAAVAATGAVVWLVTDLGIASDAISWQVSSRVHVPNRGADTRAALLQRSLADPSDDRAFARHLHPVLVAAADDRLLRHHGVDRRTQPHQARAVLGDDLADFLRDPYPGAAAREPRRLEAVVDRIEAL